MSSSTKRPQFANPLLQPTTPLATDSSATLAGTAPAPRPSKPVGAFEATHDRLTSWIDAELKQRFDTLCAEAGKGARTRLMNEAISDLLRKHKVR